MPYSIPHSLQIRYGGIDRQHLAIVKCLNDAHEIIDKETDELKKAITEEDNDTVNAAISRFLRLLIKHFALEEYLMEELNYPELDSHIVHHFECSQKILAILAQERIGSNYTLHDLTELFDALLDDVVQADLPFAAFLDRQGAQRSQIRDINELRKLAHEGETV